jgi:AcrR family transcriptional regulator
MLNHEELSAFRAAAESYEADTVARAAAGDAGAAHDVLDMAITGLLSGVISDSIRYYLAERLRRIVEDGEEPKAALGITKPACRPQETTKCAPEPVAAATEVLTRQVGKAVAVRAIGEALGMSEPTVYRYGSCAPWVTHFDDETLLSVANPALAVIRQKVRRDPLNPDYQEVRSFLIAE